MASRMNRWTRGTAVSLAATPPLAGWAHRATGCTHFPFIERLMLFLHVWGPLMCGENPSLVPYREWTRAEIVSSRFCHMGPGGRTWIVSGWLQLLRPHVQGPRVFSFATGLDFGWILYRPSDRECC